MSLLFIISGWKEGPLTGSSRGEQVVPMEESTCPPFLGCWLWKNREGGGQSGRRGQQPEGGEDRMV